jgi:hypothetical protein
VATSYWYHRPADDFPPAPVQTPVDPPGPERLNVACTQTALAPSAARRLVADWCARLPLLRNVRTLWFSSRVSQQLFDAACSMSELEGLYIKWSGIKQVDHLADLRRLAYFHLGSSTGVTSIEPLREMTRLRWLGLENLQRVRDFGVLGNLTQLEGLTLEGDMETTQHVATLAPLGALVNLRYLDLANLRADDRTLAPLFALEKLETLNLAAWWDDTEVAELRRRNPNLQASSAASGASGTTMP